MQSVKNNKKIRNWKFKTALFLNCLIAMVCFFVGLSYLASDQMTAYHREVIGCNWNELPPGVQTLLLILKKGTGMSAVITSVSMIMLLLWPYRRGENWSRWGILVIGATLLIPMLWGSIYLAITTGASSPWWANASLLAILIIAFLSARDMKVDV